MKGKVYLVGAGPGDEGLITVRGQQLLKTADVIVYDYLANPQFLKMAKPDAQCIYVGKKAGNHTLIQEDIQSLLVRLAKEGRQVVRLKGGDPYVFGRGGEEGIELFEAGIDFEVVPGISSAIGGLAYAGIPVTFRNVATSFHVVTGHLAEGTKEPDYKALAALEGTLIFLMGIGSRGHIARRLMEEGKDRDTRVAVVFNASSPKQEVVETSLRNLEAAIRPDEDRPGVIVMGEVVAKRSLLDYRSRLPLRNKRFLITRAAHQATETAEKIAGLGGIVKVLPMIEIKRMPVSTWEVYLERLDAFSWIIFTSQNSVTSFFEGLLESGRDMRCLAGIRIAAIGRATTTALRGYHIRADYVSETFMTGSLAEALAQRMTSADRVLIPASDKAGSILPDRLEQVCCVEGFPVYENEPVSYEAEVIAGEMSRADYILFTSASTVENLMAQTAGKGMTVDSAAKWVSIGPMTSEKMRAYGRQADIEASIHTVDGMLEAIVKDQTAGA